MISIYQISHDLINLKITKEKKSSCLCKADKNLCISSYCFFRGVFVGIYEFIVLPMQCFIIKVKSLQTSSIGLDSVLILDFKVLV